MQQWVVWEKPLEALRQVNKEDLFESRPNSFYKRLPLILPLPDTKIQWCIFFGGKIRVHQFPANWFTSAYIAILGCFQTNVLRMGRALWIELHRGASQDSLYPALSSVRRSVVSLQQDEEPGLILSRLRAVGI